MTHLWPILCVDLWLCVIYPKKCLETVWIKKNYSGCLACFKMTLVSIFDSFVAGFVCWFVVV